jgi:hypothetical protein
MVQEPMTDLRKLQSAVLSILFAFFGFGFSLLPGGPKFAWVAFLVGLGLGLIAWKSLWGKVGVGVNAAYFIYGVGLVIYAAGTMTFH